MKTLLVFHSMGGRTKNVAEIIAQNLDGDVRIEELKYNGNIHKLMCEQPEINEGNLSNFMFNEEILDLTQFDKIIYGTPTYGSRPSAAFFGYIKNIKNTKDKDWSLFCTCRMMAIGLFDIMKKEIEKTGGKVTHTKKFRSFFRIGRNKIIESVKSLI